MGVAHAQSQTCQSQTCQGQTATIVGTDGADRLQGTDGADRLQGTDAADVIVALAGNDRIEAFGGNDVVCAGTGDDEIRGGNGDDSLDGQEGTDRLGGEAGTDLCQNGENNAGCEDFALAINHNGPTGFLVIGGLAGCPLCVSTVEPRYIVADPLGCFYDQNSIGVVSTAGGFAGTVNLEVLNLPQGVSNQTAASVNVPGGGATSTPSASGRRLTRPPVPPRYAARHQWPHRAHREPAHLGGRPASPLPVAPCCRGRVGRRLLSARVAAVRRGRPDPAQSRTVPAFRARGQPLCADPHDRQVRFRSCSETLRPDVSVAVRG